MHPLTAPDQCDTDFFILFHDHLVDILVCHVAIPSFFEISIYGFCNSINGIRINLF